MIRATATKIAIIGSPRAGKTTLAQLMASEREPGTVGVLHADDLIPRGWSQASDDIAATLQRVDAGPLIVEGVAVVRALRKCLEVDRSAVPVARCIVLPVPRLRLSPGQERMRLGCATVLREITPELMRRGVVIEVQWPAA